MNRLSVLAATRRLLRRADLDGLIVTHLPNIRYLTAFSGSTAVALLTARECYLLLDARYLEQAAGEVRQATVVKVEKDAFTRLAELVRSLCLRRIGFESAGIRYDLYRKLGRSLGRVKLCPQDSLVESLRRIKSDAEVATIRKALRLTEAAFREVLPLIRPGLRETDLAAELEYRLRRKGAQGFSFYTIIASGPRSSYPHGVAGRRKLRPGDPIVMDFGIFLDGYASDFTRTVVLGRATGDFRRAYGAVRGALERVEASKLVGRKASWVDGVCRTYLETAGLGRYFSHPTGHGLGLEIHEAPVIGSRSAAVIRAGEVFTLEPGVYIPAQFGIRIEDVVLAGRDGCRRLTRASHRLIEL